LFSAPQVRIKQLKLSQPRQCVFQIVTAVLKLSSATPNEALFAFPFVSLAQHITLVCYPRAFASKDQPLGN